jgi:hypothetical protein
MMDSGSALRGMPASWLMHMRTLSFLFSPFGRLHPAAFILGAAVVYLAGAASYLLTTPEIMARGGLWLFAAAQAVLIWSWFILHARRLRDAGRGVGPAAGVGVLYALSIALLVIIAASFYDTLADQPADANAASALGLILLASIIAILLGSPHFDLAWLIMAILLALALVPMILAVAVTLWAAAGPSDQKRGPS